MNKFKELNAIAWDAAIAEEAAQNSRDLAWLPCKHNSDNGIPPTDSDWEAYRAADEVFMDARAARQRADEYLRVLGGSGDIAVAAAFSIYSAAYRTGHNAFCRGTGE